MIVEGAVADKDVVCYGIMHSQTFPTAVLKRKRPESLDEIGLLALEMEWEHVEPKDEPAEPIPVNAAHSNLAEQQRTTASHQNSAGSPIKPRSSRAVKSKEVRSTDTRGLGPVSPYT